MSVDIIVLSESDGKYFPKKKIKEAVNKVFKSEKIQHASVSIILCTNEFIREINKQYLDHDYATDVISFNFEERNLTGEVYISVETAIEQAKEYNVSLSNELLRLAVHGVLHLVGYDDSDEACRKNMTELENKFINNRPI